MKNIKNININDYYYALPDDKIAKYPLKKRDNSKLLVFKNKILEQDEFKNVANHLPKNSLLVFNNTKVIRARMHFLKKTGAKIEIFCIEPYLPKDYNLNFSANSKCQWLCIIGNLKKWKEGFLSHKITKNKQSATVKIQKKEKIGELQIIEFSWDNSNLVFSNILNAIGNIPIPPYLNRESEKSDQTTYQTIYSKHKGSVAAPTAGLHFTPQVFTHLKNKEITCHEVTLHVGAGTFKPVKTNTLGEHTMHYESFVITKKDITTLLEFENDITAVGTTSVRTLESIYWLGVKLICSKTNTIKTWVLQQWEAYELPSNISVKHSLKAIYSYMAKNNINNINAETGIIIAPSYKFKIVKRLITNFHQPKSTLLLLIAAIIGEDWKKLYDYALLQNFRFLSYGDSCLLEV